MRAIVANDFDTASDENLNAPYSAKMLCFCKRHFVDVYRTA